MRGRRSSRSVAVVLAGCVGLAVIAPGTALAADDPTITTSVACLAAGGTWTPTGATGEGTCDVPDTSSPATSSTTTTTTTTSTPPTVGGSTAGGSTDGATTGGTTGSTSGGTTGSTSGATAGTSTENPTSGTTPVASRQLVTRGTTELQDTLDESTADLVDNPVTSLVPIQLPDNLPFEIPTTVPEGGFTNPQQACGFFVSGLTAATPEQAAALGTAAAQFCGSLPTSFTGLDPQGLLQDLINLLKGLIPSLPGTGTGTGTIPTTPPAAVPAYFAPYWHHQYDVDCPELSYEEAQAILAADPSDPFRLDADHDGIACDRNDHEQQVVYVGYPVGGVATGDGSTSSGSDPAVVALAASLLSGLGLVGLTLVRRFAREG